MTDIRHLVPFMGYPMQMPCSLPHQDTRLVQIVDAALASAERRSGEWLICKPGCTPCCIGVFAIDQADVLRLQTGMAALDAADPQRAARVRTRALETIAISGDFKTRALPAIETWIKQRELARP